MPAIGLAALIGITIFIGLLAEAQRQYFGVFSGNLLLGLEVVLLAVAGLGFASWKKGNKRQSMCLASWGTAVFFAFSAWFVHPEQTISRAEERLGDWEQAVSNYKIEQAYGEKDKDASIRFQRLATELVARQREYEAALTRYKGDPGYFRSTFFTWSFALLAAVASILGVLICKKRNDQ